MYYDENQISENLRDSPPCLFINHRKIMIDLSKAKLFDSFRTFNGDVLQLTAIMPERDRIWKYILSNEKTYDTYTVNGEITPGLHSGKDLEAQVHIDDVDFESDEDMKLPIKLNDFCKQHHDNIVKKGFVERQHIGVLLMLTVSELSEALEADRKNKHADLECFKNVVNTIKPRICPEQAESHSFAVAFNNTIKDTFEDEIADAFLRLMDICGMLDIDIEKHIIMKSEYNKLRPAKHGKEY